MMHLAHLWTQHPGMLLVTPTTACAGWRIHDSGQNGKPGGELRLGLSDGDKTLESMRYVWMANFLGLPSIAVPAGYVDPEEGGSYSSKNKKADGKGKIPVGLMATGEWAAEKGLVEFGVAAERVGLRWRERPAGWVDVVGLARKERNRSD